MTGRWKRSRPEHAEGSARPITSHKLRKKRATSATATPAETHPSRRILDELAERLGNFHDSTRALASCLQNRDVSRKTDQSMIAAAKCMFHKLLGEASDDLDRVTPRTRETLCAETTRNKRRCSRSETPSEKSAWQNVDRWYADASADSTVTSRLLRGSPWETGIRVEDTIFV